MCCRDGKYWIGLLDLHWLSDGQLASWINWHSSMMTVAAFRNIFLSFPLFWMSDDTEIKRYRS